MSVDPSKAAEVLAALEKNYGETIHPASEYPSVPRVPTGSLVLDYACGGGVPIGRVSRIFGGYHAGKSLIAWHVIREAQKIDLSCAYWNIEKQIDPDYVRDLGVDVDALRVIEGTISEDIGAKLEALLSVVHVHVLDSLSSAVSQEELAADVGDWHRALNARVWGKVFRRVEERLTPGNVVILIDQIRDSMGYGGGFTVPGGRFLEHTSSLSLYCRRGKWLYRDKEGMLDYEPEDKKKPKTLSQSQEADGQEIIVRVEKSRIGRPYRTARMWYDFERKSFDRGYELSKCARHFGVVETSGSWMTLPGGAKIQGETKLRNLLLEDEDLAAKVIEKTMEAD